MKRILLSSLLILLIAATAVSQKALAKMDFIPVEFDRNGTAVHMHKFRKGETMYSLSKFFGVSLSDLKEINPVPVDKIKIGEVVLAPIYMDNIYKGINKYDKEGVRFIPVVYRMQPKETLYKIKSITGQSLENIMKRNKLRNSNVSADQSIILGWMLVDENNKNIDLSAVVETKKSEEEFEGEEELVEVIKDSDLPNINLDSMETFWHSQRGIAIWNKTAKTYGEKYVLHPSAKINSNIELYNPTVRRKVTAKVIGRIPDGPYKNDVSVILSPATANSLGALDSRFMVEMRYAQ